MEELDLKEIFTMFWNKKVQIILIVAIFIVIGLVYTMGFVTPKYTSSTTLVLAKAEDSKDTADSITTTEINLNAKLVSTYSELVKSKNVLRQVISNLGINVNENTLRSNISVTSVKDTELIEITVTNEVPEYAAKIANETAKVFTTKVSEIYNINNIHVVDEAEVSNNPSNINHTKDIVIFSFIGIVVASAYVLILNIFDTTVKTAEEVEKHFKIPVLASIPIYDQENEKLKRARGGRK